MGKGRSFRRDERAIEGLPIRLVIALVVGVSALAIMMNMLGGIQPPGQTEVRVEYPDGAVVEPNENGEWPSEFTIRVISEDGKVVPEAQVIITAGTAQLPDAITATTGEDGNVTINFNQGGNTPELRADQSKGTLKVEVVPPSNSDWVDEKSNTQIVIIA